MAVPLSRGFQMPSNPNRRVSKRLSTFTLLQQTIDTKQPAVQQRLCQRWGSGWAVLCKSILVLFLLRFIIQHFPNRTAQWNTESATQSTSCSRSVYSSWRFHTRREKHSTPSATYTEIREWTECCQSNRETAYYCDYQLHNGMQRREKDHSSAMKEKNEFNGQRIVCNNEGHSLQRRTLDDHVEYPSFRLSKRCQLPTP